MSESIKDTPAQVTRLPEDMARVIEQNALVSWSLPIGDSRKMFKDLTSAKGKKYRVEREIPEDEDKDAWISANSHVFDAIPPTGDDFRLLPPPAPPPSDPTYYYAHADVYWPYVKGGGYKMPEPSVIHDLRITVYNLDWNTGGYDDYVLSIVATNSGHYLFYDEEGDYYNLEVMIPSWPHSVTYDSKKPNIVSVHCWSPIPFPKK